MNYLVFLIFEMIVPYSFNTNAYLCLKMIATTAEYAHRSWI